MRPTINNNNVVLLLCLYVCFDEVLFCCCVCMWVCGLYLFYAHTRSQYSRPIFNIYICVCESGVGSEGSRLEALMKSHKSAVAIT